MPEFVIAGASGRVGTTVVRSLLAAGQEVTALTRSPARGASLQAIGASAIVETLSNTPGLTRVLGNAKGLFVILPEPTEATDFHAERRSIAESIARAVRDSGVDHVVALSSLGAQFADHMGPISDLHYFENALRGCGKPLTVVRAATFQDNVAMLIEPAVHSGIFPNFQPDRDVAISMVATRDVGAIAAKFLTEPPFEGVVDILGPWYSPRQVADELEKAVARTLQIVDIPPPAHVEAFCQAGLPRPFAEAIAELQAAIAARRITPVGDRREVGTTTLAETLAHITQRAVTAHT